MKLVTVALSAVAFVGSAASQKGVYILAETSVSDKGVSVASACTKAIPPSPSSSDDRYPYNPFLTTTTTVQRWCNGYPCGENGELRTTAAAERHGKAIEPDRTYSLIHEPIDLCTTDEVVVSTLLASSTLPAENGGPSTTSEAIFSVLPVRPTSVTGIPSEFWYLLAPTPLTDGAVPSSDLRDETSSPVVRATTAVYTIDCIHHFCPSGQPTVITMLPFLTKITIKPSRDQPPITMQTTMKSIVKRDSANMSFPDVPPKPTQTPPSLSFVSSPSWSPLPQSVATTDPCYRHYCPPGHSNPGQLPGQIFTAK